MDYPLCSVELTADMAAVRDTETCFRRGEILHVSTTCAVFPGVQVKGSVVKGSHTYVLKFKRKLSLSTRFPTQTSVDCAP